MRKCPQFDGLRPTLRRWPGLFRGARLPLCVRQVVRAAFRDVPVGLRSPFHCRFSPAMLKLDEQKAIKALMPQTELATRWQWLASLAFAAHLVVSRRSTMARSCSCRWTGRLLIVGWGAIGAPRGRGGFPWRPSWKQAEVFAAAKAEKERVGTLTGPGRCPGLWKVAPLGQAVIPSCREGTAEEQSVDRRATAIREATSCRGPVSDGVRAYFFTIARLSRWTTSS